MISASGILLGGCGLPEESAAYEPIQTETELETVDDEMEEWVREPEEEKSDVVVIDPAYDFDFSDRTASDFVSMFSVSSEEHTDVYPLLEESEWENHVVHISGEHPGPSLYIVAGVHGDEEAAWQAGKLLQTISIQSGDLYVLAPANRWGAEKEKKSRYIIEEQDLNRSFPGNPNGSASEQIADAIYQDVNRVSPVLVLDLHEARPVRSNYDFLGNSLIFTEMGEQMDLLLDILTETEDGSLCGEPFNLYGPGPEGSINRTISEKLKIPVITVETYRGYEMERRVTDHLSIVWYVLKQLDMIN